MADSEHMMQAFFSHEFSHRDCVCSMNRQEPGC